MRLIGLLNYIYTLKMKTLTLLFSLFLMCPLSVWGQSADELLSKVSDALSEGKDDYAVSLFRQAANAGEDRTEMFYWTNVDKSSEVAPRLADVLAVHYKEMRNYDKAYLFYKEFLQRHPEFNLNFTVKDDRILDYVLIEIPGVEGFESRRIEAGGQSTLSFTEKIILPNEVKSYDVTLTAVDARGNQTVTNSTISVSEMPDFPKMYLADVATVEELNSDIFGVPMVINHTGEYQYRARYYNKAAGTEIFFLPQKTDFTPICFGLDPEDNTKLPDDPETAKPIVLDEAGVYYEIDINVKESTYSMRTYSVTEATNPMKYEYGKPCFDRWENGESFIDFYIGWGGSPQDAGNQLFAQDKNNPHLFYYPENGTWTLEAGEEMNFIISNYHPDGWWDHVEWRCDDSQNVEKFGYFSKKGDVNPNWEGTNQRWEDGSMVGDNWMKPTVTVTGNYRFEFDAHLGRGKIVPAN